MEPNIVNSSPNIVNDIDNLIKVRTLTVEPSDAVSHRVLLHGEVSDDGGEDIIERGFCWSTQGTPVIQDSIVSVGKRTGSFQIFVNDLVSEQRDYARAFAKNKNGIGYGNRVTFVM